MATKIEVNTDPQGNVRINVTVDAFVPEPAMEAHFLASHIGDRFAGVTLGRELRTLRTLPVSGVGDGRTEHFFTEVPE